MSKSEPPRSWQMKKPKRAVVVFVAMALIGPNLEIFARAVTRDLVPPPALCQGWDEAHCMVATTRNFLCCQHLTVPSAAGWTSLWMWFVYGFAGLVLGQLNRTRIGRYPMLLQALIGAVMATSAELFSGLLLNRFLRLGVWDYARESHQILDQISIRSAVSFFLLAPFAFWLDDAIGFLAYNEERPAKLRYYYQSLLKWEFKQAPARAQV